MLAKEAASKDSLILEKDGIIEENAARLNEINEKMEGYLRDYTQGSTQTDEKQTQQKMKLSYKDLQNELKAQ